MSRESRSALNQGEIRQTTFKTIGLLYAKFFADSRLSHEKKDLLFELLVDQWQAGREMNAGPGGGATATASKESLERNKQLIRELIGDENVKLLDSAASDQVFQDRANEMMTAIGSQADISDLAAAQIAEIAKTFNPKDWSRNQLALVGKVDELSPVEINNVMDNEVARFDKLLADSGSALSAAQQQALHQWYSIALARDVQFINYLRKTNRH